MSHVGSKSRSKDNTPDPRTECRFPHCGWREANLMPTASDLRLTPALHVGSCSLPLRAQDPLPDTALWGTAGRWICSVIHVQLQQEIPLSTGHRVTPKDRPAPGCITVKPQRLPCRRARRSCCSEKCVCPRQTVAGHCFSMSQTSGNAPRAILFCCLEVSPYLQDVQAGSGTFPICCSLTPPFPASVCAQHCSVYQRSSLSLVQPQAVPGKCSLQLDSQRAAGRNSTTSQKRVHRLQNTLVCTHLSPLTGQAGKKDPTQPSGLIPIHLPHCYREGKMASRLCHPLPYSAPRVPVHSSVTKLRKALLTPRKPSDVLPNAGAKLVPQRAV